MTSFAVEVRILPRATILDPQGKAVGDALRALGFPEVRDAHVGRLVTLRIEAPSRGDAESRARSMCEKLLANPVTEDFAVRAEPAGLEVAS